MRPAIVTFTEDCAENIGGYFVEVGAIDNDGNKIEGIKIDDFCVHPSDLGLPDASQCDYEIARKYAEQYIQSRMSEYRSIISSYI